MSFKELGLSENLLKAIEDCGYDSPTPIQAQAIPAVLMMRDVVGLAQTGTGKTAGFTLPMIEILDGGRARARMPRSLVLAPTRELAAQVAENFETYGKYTGLSKALLTGGVSMDEQIKKLDRGVDVLIATPGRLLDLFERGKILLTGIKILVIDEADRMLDMGFIPDIEKIVSLLSPMRQTLLFSATMPPEIQKLTKKFLSNPKEISVDSVSSTADTVEQFITKTTRRGKNQALHKIMQKEDVGQAFIFCNRKRDIGSLTRWLKGKGYSAQEMHGDMDQRSRTRTLESFKNGEINLLVCSDVAGRGIDVDDLSHVFNYDVPFNADDYVHRIGRTGRAGKTGRAWMLVTKDDDKFLGAIEKLIGQKLEEEKPGGKSSKKDEKSGETSKGSRSNNSSKGKGQEKRKPSKQGNDSKKENGHDKNESDGAPKAQKHNRKKDIKAENARKKKGGAGETLGFGDEIPDFF